MKAPAGWLRAAVLALLPMATMLAGAYIDERAHLGVTNWLAACRAAGLALSAVLTFTFELLPTAVLGALAGGLAVQAVGVFLRNRGCAAQASLAAHAGCVLAMTVGLVLCTLALPIPWLLGAEAFLAASAAAWLFGWLQNRREGAPT